MEKLIVDFVEKVMVYICEVEELGGMVKVIEKGILKFWIEEVVVKI